MYIHICYMYLKVQFITFLVSQFIKLNLELSDLYCFGVVFGPVAKLYNPDYYLSGRSNNIKSG